ncbi:PREDICTED: F-box/FBD/LRR-repeat protein At4g26340-like [Camelina sativa]|uniref:F-box/FBD/LRR-repeat protein At4g26340-like n=1 Tax=Camelina sativa TaxID=90675 RepID=A0ABM0UYS7_CAMSA|nr:PREDICTED: F-box/FBD/LRR-repeat protein At4g26340-like [Camelina sativa]XP_010448284.1 PREDICTED: F-box/FBD/LRR-repeat protein At4g26340-like [Camelina sativa]
MDSISQLSDDLLLRILSCVPTKHVVATSLLSQRWRFLWMLVPQLRFDDTNHNGDYKSFSQFVYRSLLSNKAPVLQHLHLNLGAGCPAVDIRLWIDIAVSRRVIELEINIRSSKDVSFSLPSNVYTSDTLETLRLIDFVLLNAPSSVRLPSLKVLHLNTVDYVDDASLPSILSGCPNLEELFLERHVEDSVMDITVVVPSLQRLSMFDRNYLRGNGYVIDAPSLKYLNITDNAAYNFRQIVNMPELAEAHVEITHGVTHKFLRALTSVRHISLCLSLSEVMCPSGMIFSQLVHLNLYTVVEGWWDLLTYMLQDTPKLRFLKLIDKHESGFCGKETPIGWKLPSSVPECILFSLEAFEWIGYKGRRGDREMATYVLKNAANLRTATFTPESTDVGEKYRMLKELASVPTTSTFSQLLFD